VDTTETQVNDGTIESAIAKLIQPEEPEQPEVEDADYEEEDQEEPEQEPEESEEDYEGEDEEDTEEDDEEGSAPELYTVKVDGKEEQVSLEDLKRGYSGQKYVQKGMQEVAQIRKEAEETYAALMAARQQTDQLLQVAQSGQLMAHPVAPDRSKFDSDPIGYMEEKLNYEDQWQRYQKQSEQIQQTLQQQRYAEQRAQQAHLQRELDSLMTNVPEFADPKTAEKAKDLILRTGETIYGYTPEEIGMVTDHRALKVLLDAARYREMMGGKEQARKTKTAPKSRPVKGGAKQTGSNVKAIRERKSRLKKSGSIDDALGLILNA
jgi:hypothetical protein